MEVPNLSCVGERGMKKERCERREECKFYIGNYHQEVVVKMEKNEDIVYPFNCINNDYNMFEELEL